MIDGAPKHVWDGEPSDTDNVTHMSNRAIAPVWPEALFFKIKYALAEG